MNEYRPRVGEIPRVRIVIVNYNCGPEILESLRSVLASDWPTSCLEVVVVDNGSTDGSLERIENEMASVRIVRSPSNIGYAAMNLVIQDLDGVEYVGLLNPDATLDAGCLGELVHALEADQSLGAACPRILLKTTFREIRFEIDGHSRNYLDLLEAAGARDWHLAGPRVRRRWDRKVSWSVGDGTTLRADVAEGETLRLCVRANRPTRLKLRSGESSVEALIDRAPRKVSIAAGGPSHNVVQNAGSIIGKGGLGINRGYLRLDGAEFDLPVDVAAWCGAAVLMRSAYLQEVGGFDARWFLYYEDLDLSWRGLLRGWGYRYVPEAIVRHAYSTTVGHGTKVYEFHHDRNRVLTVTKNAPRGEVWATWAGAVVLVVRRVLQDVVGRALDRRKPEFVRVGRSLSALLGALRLAPAVLRDRATHSSKALNDQERLPILGRWREPD